MNGFSIRDKSGKDLRLIYEANIVSPNDTIELKLKAPPSETFYLWYGYGADPICNLVDGQDMAVPAFGPIEIKVP